MKYDPVSELIYQKDYSLRLFCGKGQRGMKGGKSQFFNSDIC